MAGPTSVIVTLSFWGRGSRRAWEKATFPCPRAPTPSGFLARSAKMGQKKAWFSQMSVRIRFGTPFDRQKQSHFSKCRSTKRKTHVLTDKRSYNMRLTGHRPNRIVRLSKQNTKKSVAAREYLWIDRLFLKSYLLRRSNLQFLLDSTDFSQRHMAKSVKRRARHGF